VGGDAGHDALSSLPRFQRPSHDDGKQEAALEHKERRPGRGLTVEKCPRVGE
jgi:hypothetical protein